MRIIGKAIKYVPTQRIKEQNSGQGKKSRPIVRLFDQPDSFKIGQTPPMPVPIIPHPMLQVYIATYKSDFI